MSRLAKNIEIFISQELHNLLFLEEFVFSRNKFKPPNSTELELADAVVMIGDVLIIYQIKERKIDRRLNAASEETWFRKKVLGDATRQIRYTLRYLQTYPEIWVMNERGHSFNLTAGSYREIIKIVIYAPSPNLPPACRGIRSYNSESAGFIHIIDVKDYLEVFRTLRVPQEIIAYFKYRENLLIHFPVECGKLPEAALAGHYIIHNDYATAPTMNEAVRIRDLVHDPSRWDLAPILRTLYESQASTDYYKILLEFIKLPRSAWRLVRERITACIQDVREDVARRPYRINDPTTGCGFVFIPMLSELVRHPNWKENSVSYLESITKLHKYDQKLNKCVGYMVGKDGPWYNSIWCLLEYDWVEDAETQCLLEQFTLFRPVEEKQIFGYFVRDDT